MNNKEILAARAVIVNKIMNLGLMINGLYTKEKEDLDRELFELQEQCKHEEVKDSICTYCGKKL